MLRLSRYISNKPVLSLRVGRPVAQAYEPIVNPNNLKIEGWFCQDLFNNSELILLRESVRDIMKDGFVINDVEELTPLDDLIRLQPIVELGFSLIGKAVFTESKQRIGKVSDYAAEPGSMIIKKLYLSQSLLRDLNTHGRVIDRTQIIEITDKKIIVSSTEIRANETVKAIARPPVATEPA